jgi:hypothetical protein
MVFHGVCYGFLHTSIDVVHAGHTSQKISETFAIWRTRG